MTTGTAPDFINVVLSREDIEAGGISGSLSVLKQLLNPDAAVRYCEKVDVGVYGYDDDPRELNEFPEVRDFIYKLDEEFPYWCYFLSKRGTGLLFILSCFCTPYLSPEVRDKIWAERIGEYLTRRGFPAMNRLCEAMGCSKAEIERMTNRVVEYIRTGPDKSES
jgi:hypothetical protein